MRTTGCGAACAADVERGATVRGRVDRLARRELPASGSRDERDPFGELLIVGDVAEPNLHGEAAIERTPARNMYDVNQDQ